MADQFTPFNEQQSVNDPFANNPQTPPPNYMVFAILTTLFCCLPFGIASIVFASQVNSKFAGGDYNGAQESSRKAKQFAIISMSVGLIVSVLYLLWIFFFGGMAMLKQSGAMNNY